MDRIETSTLRYLEELNEGNVLFEPEGPSTFPDFSVGGTTAVEVTRLVAPPNTPTGRSRDSDIPRVRDSICSAIERVTASEYPVSWFVDVEINGVPDDLRNSCQLLREFLTTIPLASVNKRTAKICDYIQVEAYPASKIFSTPFRLGAVSGRVFAGWVVSDLVGQCGYALERKSSRLSGLPSQYSQAWLAVGSFLTLGLSRDSYDSFSELFSCETDFQRLILVDYWSPNRSRMLCL